ncbi:hypothetical protein ABSDF1770 [Acinetobacter baumannii SDF]|uniref:Uncharacterized protein n=1 Tax=Acinetobacter baumannii (strain SDF) TaxID=509170 RepID=B0VNN1_ACIBS|nr:hypothetical protein ABSDF1770 [Acinetobacter baumannii SDF]
MQSGGFLVMCPFCGRSKGGLVCGYCGWVSKDKKFRFVVVKNG